MRLKVIFEALLCAAVITQTMCAAKRTRRPPYFDIEEFMKHLGKLWIIQTATSHGQQNTTCKVYDVTSVGHSKVYFGRIFYRNGERVELRLNATLTVHHHPIVKSQMDYNHVMKVTPPGEKMFYEYLLYQSPGRKCGVFLVESGNVKFHEIRLWEPYVVSPYKDCIEAYARIIPNGDSITTYYNGLCPKIFSDTN